MGQAKARLAAAEALATHWGNVSKLLAYMLIRQRTNNSQGQAQTPADERNKIILRPEDINLYNAAWPTGELHCVVRPDGAVELELMTRAKATTLTRQGPANQKSMINVAQVKP